MASSVSQFSLSDVLRLNAPRSKNDVCVLAVHVALSKESFVATEVNETNSIKLGDSQLSLPEGWNGQESYVIFYSKGDLHYVLKALPIDDNLLFTLMEYSSSPAEADSKVAVWETKPEQYIKSDVPLASSLPNPEPLMAVVSERLIAKFESSPPPDGGPGSRKGDGRTGERGPSTWDEEFFRADRRQGVPSAPGRVDVGSADLTPGGFGQGGMYFDPRRQGPPSGIGGGAAGGLGVGGGAAFVPGGHLPFGAVPPGARFDPFGPPMPPGYGDGFNPDPDHLPMPGRGGGQFGNPRGGGRGGGRWPPGGPGFGGGFGGF